jgi:hypothetical protein
VSFGELVVKSYRLGRGALRLLRGFTHRHARVKSIEDVGIGKTRESQSILWICD